MENKVIINGREISYTNEKNLLEVIRKANINIPTFCYHSELSVYGACRLCIVDIDGKGIVTSCSEKPRPGMVVKTHTKEVRNIRKIAIELLLANHEQKCTTCSKSSNCKLQDLASDLGVEEVRFATTDKKFDLDCSSESLTRDPNKCILCGDCVRACYEIQDIGAIDFAYRGSDVEVTPAFNKGLADVECVNCGQCARVCPTGSITPTNDIDKVWNEIDNSGKTVVAQIAPAVRIAIGEMFGFEPGKSFTGQMVSALKMLGFDKIYDTSYAADLTIIEESNEFLKRKAKNENLPIITSCCPAWVKFCEQYYPEYLDNLSTCKSPQQMFGSLLKDQLPETLGKDKKDIVVVAIMPCTAKKFEANRDEFNHDGIKEVDYVLTTQELAQMIKRAGIQFNKLTPESLDLPFGFKTGAGLLFGNSGGVTEAMLRYATEKITGKKEVNYVYNEVRGDEGLRELKLNIGENELNIAIVHGLKNAREIIEKVEKSEVQYDFIEVMSCPGGCVGGAGQPVYYDEEIIKERQKGIYTTDKTLQLHKSQDNPYVSKLYEEHLKEIGGEKAHKLLHTKYKNRKRIFDSEISLIDSSGKEKCEINVCIGTNCYIKGSQDLLSKMINYVEGSELKDEVDVKATFCLENCGNSPNVTLNNKLISEATFEKVTKELNAQIQEKVEA